MHSPRIGDIPFTTAAGLAAGLPYRLLNSEAFCRPTRGVRASTPPEDLAARAQGALPVLKADAAFSHVTSALLHGLPLSYAMESDDRLHFIQAIDEPRTRRPGLVCHRAHHHRVVVTVQGLRVVGLADTWVDLGELVGRGKPVGLDDLIVLGDAIATRLGSVQPLAVALAKRVRPRGKKTLVEALADIRVGSLSPRETLSRLMLVRCGLPEPVLNQAVVTADGAFLGVADLGWTKQRVAGEYQGEEFHAADDQRAEDEVRRDGFEQAGWAVEEIWKSDMTTTQARHACVRRFAAALGVDESDLVLANSEPRFFSRHAMDVALHRDEVFRRRRGW